YPRPAAQSNAGDMVSLVVEERTVDALRELSRRECVTMFTTMMAAFDVLMARYSGQEDVVVGTPTSGRKKLETRGLIGYFNNMLPLRVDLRGDPTFTELMQRVKTVAAKALDHDDVPFEKMVEVLRPGREVGRNPLFQVAYSHQNSPQEGYDLTGLSVTTFGEGDIRGIAPGTAKFDLTLGIGDAGEGELEGYVEYATDLFERRTIEDMVAHLGRLLEAIAENPDLPVSRLSLIDETEQRALVESSNRPPPERSRRPFVHERVAAHARIRPDAPALIHGEETLTFAELDRRASAVAGLLHELGAGPGAVVGIALARSFDQVTATLGALKAGAAYLPLDPGYPPERLGYMVADSRPAAVVADHAMAARLDLGSVPVLRLEDTARAGLAEVRPSLDPDDLAYVIYTSGSTGEPKGVAVTHANLAHLIDWHHSTYPMAPGERASTVAPLSFDASVWELWWPLAGGVPLVLVPDEARRDPAALVETLERHRVTAAFVPTVLLPPVLAERPPRTLKTLFVGGAQVTARPPSDYPATVVNLYGPAEAAVISTAGDVEPGGRRIAHIGTPITGARVYVLDEHLTPVPHGLPGEIFIGGNGVARGYLGRPALTAERFVPDPFSPVPGARMYRSGDRARLLRDGTIEFLGRTDEQVKVRGHRIEPVEVDAALLTHPDVIEAVTTASADASGAARLVAYLVARTAPSVSELRAFLAERLPAHMIPSAFVVVDELPLTPAGKVDRAALPAMGSERPDLSGAYEAPATDTEKLLADVWSEVLAVERVGRDDNFFDLGGDSILSIQIVARAAARGVRLAPKHVFEAQTVRELAALAPEVAPAVRPAAVTGPVPLTPIQRWYFEQDLADPHHFNQAMLLELPGSADVAALRRSLVMVTEQHDALRTRWHHDGSGWRGVIAAAEDGDLLWELDLSGRDPATVMLDMEAEATRLQASFDLTNGPLVRGMLFYFGGLQPPQLLLAIHHLVVDAISWGILVHDLATAYGALLRGEEVAFPEKTTSFREWARHLEARATELGADEKAMWIERVGSLPPAPLRRDRADGPNDVGSTEEISLELDEEQTAAVIERTAREQGVQPNETLLAALGRALAGLVDGAQLVVDVEGHGREVGESGLEVSRTVGWFTTLFPIVLDPSEDALSSLRRARRQMRAAPDHGIGYGLLRYLGGPSEAQALRAAPQAEVAFNYLGRFEGSLGGSADLVPVEGPLGRLRSPAGMRRHLIEVEAWVSEGKLRVDLVYSKHVHDRSTVSAVATAFSEAVDEIVAACAAAPGQLAEAAPVAGDADLARVVASRPGIARVYPLAPMQQGLLFHSLYETAGSLYFEQLALSLEGSLDPARMDEAWRRVARRHPILAAAVVWEGIPEPVLAIPSEPRVDVSHHDWTQDPEPVEDRLQRFLAEDRAAGLDLAAGPLMRVALIRVGEGAHRMVWSHHHLLVDGWTVQLVLGELMALYEDLSRTDLGTPGSYEDFVAWLRARDPAEAEGYWRSELAGFDSPTDLRLAAPAEPAEGHGMVQAFLDESVSAAAASFARRARVTLATVVEAAWAATIGVYSGDDDVVFGAIMSGRSAPVDDIERTAGLFINAVPVRIGMPGRTTVAEWLTGLQGAALERRRFEHTSLVDVQQWSEIAAPTPLFETLIAFENYPVEDVWDEEVASVRLSGAPTSENTNYPVSMVIVPGDRLTFRLSYDRSRLDRAGATALVERFAALLRMLIEDPARPVSALVALTEDDRAALARFNETRVDYANDLLVHEMFEAQAARRPDAEAVAHGAQSVTYGELNERADALAHHLRDLGVGPEVLVAVCCERTVDMVAGLLAVLKAGGAYVPVDPRYPAERIAYMLRDTAAPVLLTERGLADRLPAGEAKVVLLDARGNGSSGMPAPARTRAERNDVAYVLYTSGSTGRPKG
ncbi:MAG: amino acid adenylation domain-containing protein, partial [Actinomycetota bacterium]|nr:amino acid adenylation domain-containing protein [Actinomycetota bacterium]